MASAGAAAGQRGRPSAHAFRPLAGVLVFLGLWEVVGRAGLVNSRLVPPPSIVFVALVRVLGERVFLADMRSTALSWLIAVVLATFAGVTVGLALGSLPWLRAAGTILVEFLLPLPVVVLIPLAISLIGAGARATITLAVFAAVWPVLSHTLHALGELDPTFTEVARSYRVAWWRTVLWVTVPAALPCVLTGVRRTASVALISVVSTEFLAGPSGLGQFLRGAGRMDLVLAGTVFAGLLGLLANLLINVAQRRVKGAQGE
jgi:NitT/TauT family transport system permease protein